MKKSARYLRFLEYMARRTLHAVTDRHPELFDRLGEYATCRYLIDVKDTPFILLLLPEKRGIHLHRRSEKVRGEATIRGSFMTLVRLAQGGGDGDALFFSRDIEISGNTEAVLALRNALDDSSLDILHDSLDALGFWGSPLRFGYKAFKEIRPIISGMFAP